MKGVSVAVAMVILLVVLMVVLVPALIFLNDVRVYSYQGRFQGSAMAQIQEQQDNQVYRGNPTIYYNSSIHPSLEFFFGSVPTQVNISQIYYYNGTMWVPVLQTNIIVASDVALPLPSKAFNKPVIVLTALENVYLLNPNTSTPLLPPSSPGKYPLYILAFAPSPLSTNNKCFSPPRFVVDIQFQGETVQLGGLTAGVVYYVSPGVYAVNDTTLSTALTTFKGWYIIGDGAIIFQNQGFAVFRISGPAVLEAIYEG